MYKSIDQLQKVLSSSRASGCGDVKSCMLLKGGAKKNVWKGLLSSL